MQMQKKIIIGVTIILVMAFLVLYGQVKDGKSNGTKTVKVEEGALYSTIRAIGRVKSSSEAQLSAANAGQIVDVLVKEGQSVDREHVLIKLDGGEADARVANAEAALREALLNVELTKHTKESLEQVWQVGGTSLQSVKDAESKFQVAITAQDKAAAELRSAHLMRDKLKIVAPFAGLVTKISARVGEWASVGATLITLAGEKEREIDVLVDDMDAGLVAKGQSVEVSSDAYPGRLWIERVVRIDPAVQKEGTANTITVHVSLATSNARELRLGQQVDAKIRTVYKEHTLKLPFEALINKDGKMFVAIMNNGEVDLKPVVAGIEDATHIEIVEGIQAGQEVILPEGKRLKDGKPARKGRDIGL